MDTLTLVLFIAGFFLLVFGADWLVRGAGNLAALAGISPLVIGLTVVAFGTSAPELAVSVTAAYQGAADLALGNVVGSNIANILLILGISALVAPLFVSAQLLRNDIPIMLGVSVLTMFLALDGNIGRWNGVLLFAGIIAYTVWSIYESRKAGKTDDPEALEDVKLDEDRSPLSIARNVALLVVGIGLLTLGSNWLVNGAMALAALFGVPEIIVGLTIVAFGTSLPELATSVVASMRGERDIAVGNIIGSNLFNLTSVLGLTAIVAPNGIPVPEIALTFDLPVMLAVAFATVPIFISGYVITRGNGALFLFYYLAYLGFEIIEALAPDWLGRYQLAMGEFIVPITIVIVTVTMVAFVRREQPTVRERDPA